MALALARMAPPEAPPAARRQRRRRALSASSLLALSVSASGAAAAADAGAGGGAEPALRRCLARATEGLASQRGTEGGKVQASFFNDLGDDDPALVFWLDERGDEVPLGQVPPGASHSWSSFSGHAMRVRQGSAEGLLLLEVVLGSQGDQRYDISPCGGAGAASSVPNDVAWLEQHGARDGAALAECPLSVLLSEVQMRGFHVLCFLGAASGEAERVCAFKDGLEAPRCTHSAALEGGETVEGLAGAMLGLIRPGWRPRKMAPLPAIFTASGRRLPGDLSLKDVGVPSYRRALVLLEGGEWHWPPVRVGFERKLPFVTSGVPGGIVLRTLSLLPRVFAVDSFIEEKECDRILEKAGPHVQKSQVVVKDQDIGKDVDSWRTSFNYFLPSTGDAILEGLDERVQNLTRIPIVNSEYSQILKYEHMGRYTAHTDYFAPEDYQKDENTLRMIAHGARNRLLTVFMYMSDVAEGGETVFPAHGGKPGPFNFEDCSKGLKVKPERRKVMIFYNMHPNGDPDPHSLHGGCRVLNGTKWSANFWVWNYKQSYKRGRSFDNMVARLNEWQPDRDRSEEADVAALAFGGALGKPEL